MTTKLWRGVNHERKATAEDEKLVKADMAPLMEVDRFRDIVLQFPISFQNTRNNRQYVGQLQRNFREYPLVVKDRYGTICEIAYIGSILAGTHGRQQQVHRRS